MKRILFIPTNQWVVWGGSEMLWTETALEMTRSNDWHVGIYARPWKPLHKAFTDLYKKAEVFEQLTEIAFLGRVFNRFIPSRDLYFDHFQKCIKTFEPSLAVISQAGNTEGLRYMEFCSALRIPFVTISQAASEAQWPWPDRSLKLAHAFNSAVANLFVSRHNLQLSEKQAATVIRNSRVIANPFNVPYEAQTAYPPTDTFRLACVARLELFAKGQDVILETLSAAKWRDRNLEVLLYGDGIDRENVRRLIEYFKVKNVKMMGHVDPTEIWRNCHGLILSSRYEGLPLALVEAMLCSRVSIVTDVGGNAEVIEEGRSGFIAAAPTASSLDDALERAWTRREEWQTMGAFASAAIRQRIPRAPARELVKILEGIAHE